MRRGRHLRGRRWVGRRRRQYRGADGLAPLEIPTSPNGYAALEPHQQRLNSLREAAAVLHWDTAAMMPEGGAAARAEQLATLRVVCHEVLADAALPDLLDGAEDEKLERWQAANLREMRRQWLHANAIPADLVAALSKAASLCEMVWRKARPASDFALVLPHLEKLLSLVREKAAAKADRLGTSRYEALLDQWEPDGSTAAIDRLFGPLAKELPALIEGALAHQALGPAARARAVAARRPVPDRGAAHGEPQASWRQLGIRFRAWPARCERAFLRFCGGTPDDVRITTRYERGRISRAP